MHSCEWQNHMYIILRLGETNLLERTHNGVLLKTNLLYHKNR